MIALFDIGNSRIKWAGIPETAQSFPELQRPGSASHAGDSLREIASANWRDWPAPSRIMVSAVAAESHWRSFCDWCERHWQQTPERLISPAQGGGLRNAYEKPEDLGSDRWAAMIAARQLVDGSFCVIDCGTAITLDFVDAEGQHLGGYIAPGLALMRKSLGQGTARVVSELPAREENRAPDAWSAGKTTGECVEKGIIMAASGLIDRAVDEMQARHGCRFRCLLSGGGAPALVNFLRHDIRPEPHLVLLGLAHIAWQQEQTGRTKSV